MMKKLFLVAALLALLPLCSQAQVITPQGRLSLTSGVSVMTGSVTAASTVYYVCHSGNNVRVGGTDLTIGACNISTGLAAANVLSGSIYDIYVVNNGGTATLCVGPAWTSTTNRGTGAGTAEITQTTDGLWTNANSLTNCYGGAAGTTDYGAVSANAGTAVGCLYATANGQTGLQFFPAPAAGGSNTIVALGNMYNKVLSRHASVDSTTSWTYNSATWRAANNNAANRVTYVDCLGQSQVSASWSIDCSSGTSNGCGAGVNFGSTSATPTGVVGLTFNNEGQIAGGNSNIALGLTYAQAMEARLSGSGTMTYWCSQASVATCALSLFMMN